MNKYDNFFVPVDDLQEAVKYYVNVLGLELKFDFSDKGMVAFNVGDEEPAIILKEKSKFPDVKPAIWLVADNVNDEYQRLRKNGVKFLSEPFQIGTGHAVEFEDIDGNRFGIADYQ
ncbi:VOC family protein [Acetobacterium woodii]|uniref:VOC domain-containing protein n=1 Tax=Acetobacterium woodii (strain ATCC 29683 / DSM 1030 / JCM 2381 / KCTC 1655 / WB1) TaxID=931626 RepID=H6LHE1_ACEWD|nr:VOC family protein [Acetobacterium woodii]AFA49651.1 hypothetical protein Awo_c29170 [Acetobacterium woodii DSM 1030]